MYVPYLTLCEKQNQKVFNKMFAITLVVLSMLLYNYSLIKNKKLYVNVQYIDYALTSKKFIQL